ncbi:MAG: hypothetical protein ABEI54_01445 [Candidatus Bipolaricaulia bacterium]
MNRYQSGAPGWMLPGGLKVESAGAGEYVCFKCGKSYLIMEEVI